MTSQHLLFCAIGMLISNATIFRAIVHFSHRCRFSTPLRSLIDEGLLKPLVVLLLANVTSIVVLIESSRTPDITAPILVGVSSCLEVGVLFGWAYAVLKNRILRFRYLMLYDVDPCIYSALEFKSVLKTRPAPDTEYLVFLQKSMLFFQSMTYWLKFAQSEPARHAVRLSLVQTLSQLETLIDTATPVISGESPRSCRF